MDFGFTEEQERLRKEVHDFYINELPADFEGHIASMGEEIQALYMGLQEKAAKKGYLTPGWPKEYGGLGLGSVAQGVVNEEQGKWKIRWPNNIGYSLAGPGLLLFGTDEQKKRFIPPMTRGEVVWIECFTEPDAGSDEANQHTRAVKDGDYFVFNGQKTFITSIFKPDWLYTEARTADTTPKHRGISLFLIPADTPGITYRPLPTMMHVGQNEVFFDNVRVSKEYLLGELNRGFYHAMATFEFERSGTSDPALCRRRLEELVEFCKEEKRNGKPLIEDPEVRKILAQIAVECEVYKLVAWHTVWWFGQREKLGPKPYDLSGFFNKIVNTKHPEAMTNILGLYGQLRKGSKWAKLAGEVEAEWRHARSLHAAGTFEVNKIVLAGRGLGLPRIPAKFNTEITAALQESR